MATIDKSLPNTMTEVEIPGEEEIVEAREEAVEELYLCRHNPAQQYVVSTTYRLLRELIGLRNLRNYGLYE
jgi:hypothetical protein